MQPTHLLLTSINDNEQLFISCRWPQKPLDSGQNGTFPACHQALGAKAGVVGSNPTGGSSCGFDLRRYFSVRRHLHFYARTRLLLTSIVFALSRCRRFRSRVGRIESTQHGARVDGFFVFLDIETTPSEAWHATHKARPLPRRITQPRNQSDTACAGRYGKTAAPPSWAPTS